MTMTISKCPFDGPWEQQPAIDEPCPVCGDLGYWPQEGGEASISKCVSISFENTISDLIEENTRLKRAFLLTDQVIVPTQITPDMVEAGQEYVNSIYQVTDSKSPRIFDWNKLYAAIINARPRT
jgi:hypothetical protein